MKLLALIALLVPSLAWAECPKLTGEWLMELDLESNLASTLDFHTVGYLVFHGDGTASYTYGYADADIADDIQYTFGLGLLSVEQISDCSVLLREDTGNINFAGMTLRLFPKGRAQARVIAVDPDFFMDGRGTAEKKHWRAL